VTARLLFDSVSTNTGDLAIGIANAQLLGRRGLETLVVDPFAPPTEQPLLVGGGELIRPRGDEFYDAFRPSGQHILHAAGVWTDADELDYLHSYDVVSARSTREAAVLRPARPDVRVLPCSTTLLESPHFEIPGARPDDRLVGIHLVPHALRLIDDLVPLINAIPGRKVFLPFTHYNADYSFMAAMPFDRDDAIVLGRLSPLELHSVIGQLDYAVVSSLHASIFAFSQNVPFASIHQKKVEYYFADRGLAEHVVASGPQLEQLVQRLEHDRFDFTELIERDRAAVDEAFDEYAQLLRSEGTDAAAQTIDTGAAPLDRRSSILLDQAEQVIGDRDLSLGLSEGRRRLALGELDERTRHVTELDRLVERLRSQAVQDAARYDDLAQRYDRLASRWWVRAATALSGVGRRIRRHPASDHNRPQ
jgi:hypothetical protein